HGCGEPRGGVGRSIETARPDVFCDLRKMLVDRAEFRHECRPVHLPRRGIETLRCLGAWHRDIHGFGRMPAGAFAPDALARHYAEMLCRENHILLWSQSWAG